MKKRKQILKPFLDSSGTFASRITTGIEENRKGNAVLEIMDQDGRHISGASVSVALKNHAFLHGCNLFLLDEIDDPVKNETAKARFVEVFNQATLPFYWKDIEPENGKYRYGIDSPRIYRRPVPDLCLSFCERNGIVPKAHCLNYYNETPEWVSKESAVFWKMLERRFSDLAERYADRIPEWEVTNETLRFFVEQNVRRGVSPFYDRDFVEQSFLLAEKYFPQNEKIINEAHFNIWGENFKEDRSAYYMQIERALSRGAGIDAIGLQFHMFFPKESELRDTEHYYDPYSLFGVMDRYADFGLPLQITEITIPAYSNDPEDEEIQAMLLKNLYQIWFSHPNMLIYSASKAAQINMVKSLAMQLAKYGVTVNNVAPGVIYTDRNIEALSDPIYAKKVIDSIPVGFYGRPDDCAGIVSFLCSEEGRYITGQSIFVDGGKSIK